jgi:hypothetical protein
MGSKSSTGSKRWRDEGFNRWARRRADGEMVGEVDKLRFVRRSWVQRRFDGYWVGGELGELL